MALKHYIKVTATNHVLEVHSFDDSVELPAGLTEVASNPHDFRLAMNPDHIMLWTEEEGFSSIDIYSEEALEVLGSIIIEEDE
jgi:hypothetical protein